MKNIKRLVCGLLAATMMISLTACGGGDSSKPANSGSGDAGSGGAANARTLRFSVQQPVDSAAHKSAMRIKEKVEKETNGEILIDIYPAAQLGDWTQCYDELMMGTLDMANNSVPDTYDAKMAAGFLPYLAYNYDELRKVFAKDSFLVQSMSEIQEKQDVKFLGYFCDGFCGVASNQEIKNANVSNADKGILIRTPGVDAWKFPFDRLGFRTSTIPYSDTYAALQTGVVDGWTGAPPYVHYSGYRDVEKYYYAYDAVHESTQLLMSMKVWDSLTPDQQKIVGEAFAEESANSIDISEKSDEEYKKMLNDAGIKVVEFTDEEKKAMSEDVRTHVWKQLEEAYTPEFLQSLRDSLK